MVEGEAKIAKQQQVALQLARNAAKAKYGADSEQFILFNEQLEIADAAAGANCVLSSRIVPLN